MYVTAIYIVNAVFLTMFMLSNLIDIYEIVDTDEELKPLTPLEPQMLATDELARGENKNLSKTPSPVLRDLYLSSIGQ